MIRALKVESKSRHVLDDLPVLPAARRSNGGARVAVTCTEERANSCGSGKAAAAAFPLQHSSSPRENRSRGGITAQLFSPSKPTACLAMTAVQRRINVIGANRVALFRTCQETRRCRPRCPFGARAGIWMPSVR